MSLQVEGRRIAKPANGKFHVEHGEAPPSHLTPIRPKGSGIAHVAGRPPPIHAHSCPARTHHTSRCYAENQYRGAARVFPPGDAWCDDSILVYCVLPALPTNPLAVFNGLRQHQLRAGGGGDNPGRKDAHGNTVYRCNVHGQYRLHFTRDGAERVTFLSVNTHDDLLL